MFISASGVITLASEKSAASVQRTDGFFIEAGDGMSDVNVTGNTISLKNAANVNKGL